MAGLSWWPRNSDTFPVGVPHLEMTGLPGKFLRRLWILGNRYNFPKLVVFLYLEEKYLKLFSEIAPIYSESS